MQGSRLESDATSSGQGSSWNRCTLLQAARCVRGGKQCRAGGEVHIAAPSICAPVR